ncbi:type 4a pilus biogenesis protein PilO [Candidatus Daviesbacteria bacterium]|nr:type 4a pilus biogenesis protein PilO [Candidatus Daviesbacteria bacterium]
MNRIKEQLSEVFSNPALSRYKVMVVPVFSALVCLILIILIIVPHIKSLNETNKLIKDINIRNDTLSKKLDILRQTDKALYQDNFKLALAAVPAEKDVPGAANQLLFLLQSSKMQLDDMNFAISGNAQPSSDKISDYVINITATGEVSALKEFILKVKDAARVMKINQLDITGGRASNNIQVTLTLAAFYQGVPTSIGNIDQPVSSLSTDEEALLAQIKNFQKNTPIIESEEVTGAKGKSNPFQ